ncbi:hypothetical protein SAMN05444411_1187 [Lutibacter oricola]|uniref:Uncharacterized protein n=1 Tax=Lutibacter oricola TaxID=762486 RepID=A0A1H3GVP6_9FLAO|nr:hypothetical protein [Lutibacter oricola]SDY06718.1 hypothetical protein SAMN05444411_1187 [Lutibacter oricola]
MKKSIIILIGLLYLGVCRGQSEYVILSKQSTLDELILTYKVLPKNAKKAELSDEEFRLVGKKTQEYIEIYNTQVNEGFKKRGEKKKYAKMYRIMKLTNYKIQYVPYLNQKGEKEIWINGFCDDFNSDWRKEIISVFDGGNCYFTIKLNLSSGECLSIGTNGYA